jgi:hypothetical protein
MNAGKTALLTVRAAERHKTVAGFAKKTIVFEGEVHNAEHNRFVATAPLGVVSRPRRALTDHFRWTIALELKLS